MRRQKPLSLPVGFELAEDLLSFTHRPVRDFDLIVQALVGAMRSVWGECPNRFDIATQLIRFLTDNHAPRSQQAFDICRT
jgi:hypothetical protein